VFCRESPPEYAGLTSPDVFALTPVVQPFRAGLAFGGRARAKALDYRIFAVQQPVAI